MSHRIGIVTQLDPARAKAKVRFPDHDDVESWWLPVLQQKTLSDRSYWMPDVDSQVICNMDDGEEAGVILGAIYSDADPPPASDANVQTTIYSDGAQVGYDKNSGTWTVNLPGGAARVTVGGVVLEVSPGGVAITGGTVTHNGKDIGDTHTHGGILPGSASTDVPN